MCRSGGFSLEPAGPFDQLELFLLGAASTACERREPAPARDGGHPARGRRPRISSHQEIPPLRIVLLWVDVLDGGAGAGSPAPRRRRQPDDSGTARRLARLDAERAVP